MRFMPAREDIDSNREAHIVEKRARLGRVLRDSRAYGPNHKGHGPNVPFHGVPPEASTSLAPP